MTKEPLDPVLLTLTSVDSSNEGKEAVSDIYGRFEFLADEGRYVMTAGKTNYLFPSKRLLGRRSDGVYDDLYFGEEISVSNNQRIMHNIPMDPIAVDWNQEEKRRMRLYSINKFISSLSVFTNSFFYLALGWSIVATILSPNLTNFIIDIILIVFVVILLLGRSKKSIGLVVDRQGNPLEGMIVRLIDEKMPLFRYPPVVTSKYGKYSFLVKKGTYRIVVEHQEGGGVEEVYRSQPFEVKTQTGQIAKKIILD